ncbi:hypothetical protein BH10ACI1_BH10ACI1_14800 [soil metagenome]
MVFPSAEQLKNSEENFSKDWGKSQVVGKIETSEINESSGIAASRCNENVFWTHNDSGDDAFIYALDAKGKKLGTWKVSGATNIDWEDIATRKEKSGECFLYVGEIGNNKLTRNEFTIYRVKEPLVSDENKSSSKKNPLTTETAEAIKFNYPDTTHNAETLMIHPETGDIYIVSKQLSGAAGVYKLKANYLLEKMNTLEKIANITVPSIPNGLLTGGDISPDGKRVVVCDYFNAYEFILPEKAKNFDEIWAQTPATVELGNREVGEAVGYAADGRSMFATSEKNNSPFIQVKRK